MLAAGHARLSERSRLRRLLAPKPRLTASDLRYLTEVDGIDHYAVVAALRGQTDCVIAGVARWVRLGGEPPPAPPGRRSSSPTISRARGSGGCWHSTSRTPLGRAASAASAPRFCRTTRPR